MIKAVIVDEVPESAYQCSAAETTWNPNDMLHNIDCKLTLGRARMSAARHFRERCPDCPLMTEAEYQARNTEGQA